MKISRSKIIEIGSTITILIFIFVYSFGLNKIEKENNTYAFNELSVEEENDKVEDTETIENLVVEEIESIVYDNMTMEELSNKLERSLNSDISGYGNFIATYALSKGVDPYLATAIMLHETGCTWGCSNLVKKCNNVGGMKGSGCGSYGYFNTLEEGIEKFIDNIYNNYYVYGLTTASLMGNKYAEDPEWSRKVDAHIEKIKNR